MEGSNKNLNLVLQGVNSSLTMQVTRRVLIEIIGRQLVTGWRYEPTVYRIEVLSVQKKERKTVSKSHLVAKFTLLTSEPLSGTASALHRLMFSTLSGTRTRSIPNLFIWESPLPLPPGCPAVFQLFRCRSEFVMIPFVSSRLIMWINKRVLPVPEATMVPRALPDFLVQLGPRAPRVKRDRAARTGMLDQRGWGDPLAHQGRETLAHVSTGSRPQKWRWAQARLRTSSSMSRRQVSFRCLRQDVRLKPNAKEITTQVAPRISTTNPVYWLSWRIFPLYTC